MIFIQHTSLKPYATKSWPFYRKMQNFMPGTQPRGTHSFDPSNVSAQSTQMLNNVNAEEDGAEDQSGPLLDTSADITGPSSFPVTSTNIAGPSSFPVTSNLDIMGFVASGESSPSFLPDFSSSGGTRPPSSSSLPPTVHLHSTQRRDISMDSAISLNTDSDPGNTKNRKRKHDGRSAGGTRPPSSKRSLKSKTSDLNPVIMTNALNSTLNRLADVMEKSLDANAPSIAPPMTNATPPTVTYPSASQTTLPSSNPPSASESESPQELLNQAMRLTTSDDTLSEDELLAASLFFTSATEAAVRAARTFIQLNNNQTVQRRFLLTQLNLASLLPGKGKGKAVEGDDDSMTY
jgi:hypothetical protein